jgi:hypothetical protein
VLKATLEASVKDAYAGLKGLVLRKLGKQGDVAGAVESVEKKPESAGHKQVLQEELTAAGAGRDQEVVDTATELLKLLEGNSPGITGGLVGQINAAGGKVLVVGTNAGTINM